MVLPERFELSTSPLPRECSTPELRQLILIATHQVSLQAILLLASDQDLDPHREFGEPRWARTTDLLIKSQLLYQLSYGPTVLVTRPVV